MNPALVTCLEQCDGLCVQPPVVPLLHGPLVGVVDEPALLQDLGPDPLRLLDRLDQALNGDVGLGGGRPGVGLQQDEKK